MVTPPHPHPHTGPLQKPFHEMRERTSDGLLIFGSPLSEGIEDAFKTAATEVSLLAGTDEFNATELFGVGEVLRPVLFFSSRRSLVHMLPRYQRRRKTTWQPRSLTQLAFLALRLKMRGR